MRGEIGFAVIILAAALAIDGVIIAATIASWSALVPDFFAFWSTALFLQTHRAAAAYDLIALASFQQNLLARFTAAYPAPYSPIFLLAIHPLAWLDYASAYLAWVGLTGAAFFLAARPLFRHPAWLIALLLAPAIVLNAVYGQTGFLSGALMLGALVLMERRPWSAGLCLALLAFKPQLGLIMPIVLLARRDWASIGAGLVWLAGLILVSSALLGPSIWLDWLHTITGHASLIADSQHHLLPIMATVTAGARLLGAPILLAQLAQAMVALAVMATVWTAWRGAERPLALAITLVGAFLVTPYAFTYDLPAAMCGALVFLHWLRGRAQPAKISGLELGAVLLALLAPLFIFTDSSVLPMVPLSLLILFASMARHVWSGANSASGAQPLFQQPP